MLRRRTRHGRSASRRMRAGGPRARGRRAASWAEWASIREQVLARAGWRCQACRVRRRLDVHHVVKRSQGGSDFDLDQLVALCRWCHDQTDAPYERGRLVVIASGAGQFTFEVLRRAGRGPLKPNPTFAHVGKTEARDVACGPDRTTVDTQSNAL